MLIKTLLGGVAVIAIFAATPAYAQKAKRGRPVQTAAGPVFGKQSTLTLERIMEGGDLSGATPDQLRFSPDGRYLTFLRARPDDRDRKDLWTIDPVTGQERMLVDTKALGSAGELSEAEKMQRERLRVGSATGLIRYDWTPDGKAIFAPLNGEQLIVALDGKVTRLPETARGALNPTVSPKGSSLSFVKDGELYVYPLTGDGAPRKITSGASETVHWGVAEFVADEEIGRHTGHWWAGDDSRIAVARVDEGPVGIVSRAAIGATGTKVVDQRYPAAGKANAIVDLYVMRPDGSERVKVDMGADSDIYLARVNWAEDGRTLYVQRQNRAQTRLDLLAVDPATGKSRLMFSETQPRWINLHDDFRPLKDGSLLWSSERDGYNHLYRFKDGQWIQLTRGPWMVSQVDRVDEAGDRIYFTGNKDGVLEPQGYWVPLSRIAEPVRVTETGWSNSLSVAKNGQMIVTRSNPVQPPQVYLADRDGKRTKWIAENRVEGSHPYAPYMAAHRPTEYGTIKAADGTPLYWQMIKPANMRKGARYPVFIQHYGGPTSRQVGRRWGSALHQYLAQQGWVVFTIDNRGSPDRGKAFEDQLHRAMGTVEVADQMAGARYVKSLPFVDPAKVAIYGWSYGGYMTLKLLEAAPKGFYAAGISGAPVTDWSLYDTHYTERYMGIPQDGDAYKRASALDHARDLKGSLLLVHGMADDNVVFTNSTAMMGALQRAAIPFETMVYPGQTHRVGGPGVGLHLWRTIENFLNREVRDRK